MMPSQRAQAGVGKILIVSNYDGFFLLSPAKKEIIGTAFESEGLDMPNQPRGALRAKPHRHVKRNILIQENVKRCLRHEPEPFLRQ